MRRGRKGNDLFQLLQARARGGPVSRRGRSESVSTLGAVGEWLRGLWAPAQKSSLRRPVGRSNSTATAVLPIVGLALACVALGFWLGRATAAAAGGPGLRVPEVPRRAEPGVLPLPPSPAPGAADLTADQEIETLSISHLRLLTYPEPERQRASELAHYLRTQGLDNARIKLCVSKSGQQVWLVLVYLLDSDKDSWPEQRRLLAAVKNPPFEPRLENRVHSRIYEFK